jgi:uracil permease
MDDIAVERRVVLGLQHTVAMFGATVLVPLILGMSPSIALLSAGIGTLLFHLVTKGIVPVFLGSSFAFLAPIGLATAEGYSFVSIGAGIMAAGVVYLIVSFLVTVIPDGSHKLRALFPPVVTGPIIAVIGITLAPIAIGQAQGNWWLALVALGSVIVASIWFRGLFKMLPILTGFIVGYLVSIIFGQVEWTNFNAANWIDWPDFGGLFAGGDFDFGAVWLIAPVALVTMIEHVGDILTNGRVVGKDFFDNPGVNKTLLGDGIATLLAGLIGGPPNTTYSENTGVLAVTKVYDPRVLRIGAIFAILLGFIPKFGGFLQDTPLPVLGGISIVLFGMIASIGMRVLTESRVDFTQSRNLIVAALILVFGLGVSGLESPIEIGDVQVSGLALAAVIGVVANLVLPKAIDEPEYEEAAEKAA